MINPIVDTVAWTVRLPSQTEKPGYDPYGGCERQCHHDLAKGVLLEELLGGDGPYVQPMGHPEAVLARIRRGLAR